jgi:four helix bundle protein
MHNYKNLDIWKLSIEICRITYQIVSKYPKDEKFGLISQIKRSVVSISSNIAEGSSRNSDKEFIRYLDISLGSSFELETQIIISKDVNLISNENFITLVEKLNIIQKKIYTFKKKLSTLKIEN